MDNKKVLAEVFRKLTIKTEDIEIPILNRMTESIEIHCNDGGISDFKVKLRAT